MESRHFPVPCCAHAPRLEEQGGKFRLSCSVCGRGAGDKFLKSEAAAKRAWTDNPAPWDTRTSQPPPRPPG